MYKIWHFKAQISLICRFEVDLTVSVEFSLGSILENAYQRS